MGVTLEPQHTMRSPKGNRIVIDGSNNRSNTDFLSPTGKRRTWMTTSRKAIQEKRYIRDTRLTISLFQNPRSRNIVSEQKKKCWIRTSPTPLTLLRHSIIFSRTQVPLLAIGMRQSINSVRSDSGTRRQVERTCRSKQHNTNTGFKEAFSGFLPDLSHLDQPRSLTVSR